LNIGEVAKMAELPIKTIRYYEEIGFIKPKRSANGYRSFRVSDVHKLAFLGRARSLGFSIEDCRALLQLYENDTRASADVKQIAQENMARIDAKVKELQAMRNTLSDLIGACAGDDRPACPILSDLATLC
jgi:Cu(I)-responsive transcriptional regulator